MKSFFYNQVYLEKSEASGIGPEGSQKETESDVEKSETEKKEADAEALEEKIEEQKKEFEEMEDDARELHQKLDNLKKEAKEVGAKLPEKQVDDIEERIDDLEFAVGKVEDLHEAEYGELGDIATQVSEETSFDFSEAVNMLGSAETSSEFSLTTEKPEPEESFEKNEEVEISEEDLPEPPDVPTIGNEKETGEIPREITISKEQFWDWEDDLQESLQKEMGNEKIDGVIDNLENNVKNNEEMLARAEELEQEEGVDTTEEQARIESKIDRLQKYIDLFESKKTGKEVANTQKTETTEEEGETKAEQIDANSQLEQMSNLYEQLNQTEDEQEQEEISSKIDQIVENLQEDTDLSDEEIFSRFEEIHAGEEEGEDEEEWKFSVQEGEVYTVKNENGSELGEIKITNLDKDNNSAEYVIVGEEEEGSASLGEYELNNFEFVGEKTEVPEGENEKEKSRSVELPRKLVREAMTTQGESEEIIDALIESNSEQATNIVENLFDNLPEGQKKRLQETLKEQGWEMDEFLEKWKEEIAKDVVDMYQQEINKKIQEKVQEQMTWDDKLKAGWKNMAKKVGIMGGSMAAGAAAGGTAGSVFGPIGTLVGGTIGARFAKGGVETAAESDQAMVEEEEWKEEEQEAEELIAEEEGYTEDAKQEIKAEMRAAFDTDRQYMLADTINRKLSQATEEASLMERKNEILKEKAEGMKEKGMEKEAINAQLEILSNELDQTIVDAMEDGRSFMDAAVENGASEQAVEVLAEEGFGDMPESFKDSDTEKALKRFGIPAAAGATTTLGAAAGGTAGAYMAYGAGKGMEAGARIGESFDKSEVSEEMQDRIEVIQTQVTNRLDKYNTEEKIKDASTEELIDDLVKVKGALDNGVIDEKVVEEFDVVKEAGVEERTQVLKQELTREVNNRKLENLDENLSEVEGRVEEEVEEQTGEAAEKSGREDVEYILPDVEEKKRKYLGAILGTVAGTVAGNLLSGYGESTGAGEPQEEMAGGAGDTAEEPRDINLEPTKIEGEVPADFEGNWVQAESGDGLEDLARKSFESVSDDEQQKILDAIGASNKEEYMDQMRDVFSENPEYDIEYAGSDESLDHIEGAEPTTAEEVEHGSMVYEDSEFKIDIENGQLKIEDKNIGDIGESHEWTVGQETTPESKTATAGGTTAEETPTSGSESSTGEAETFTTTETETTGAEKAEASTTGEAESTGETGEGSSAEAQAETTPETVLKEEETTRLVTESGEVDITVDENESVSIEIPNQEVDVTEEEINKITASGETTDAFSEMDATNLVLKDEAFELLKKNRSISKEVLKKVKNQIRKDINNLESTSDLEIAGEIKSKYE